MKTILTIVTADWAPHLEQAARRFAAVCVIVFCAGWALGAFVHRLNDQLTRLLTGATRQAPRVPAATPRPLALPPARDPAPEPVQVFAIAAVPAHSGFGCAADPMARAVRLARKGLSQRKAAAICGVKRSSLQRALKAA